MIQIGSPPPISSSGQIKPVTDNHDRVADSKQLRDPPKKKPVVDRRKQKDRRKQQSKGFILESRSGQDRRKNDSPSLPSIDTTA